MRANAGISVLELMVSIAIFGIASAIGLLNYQDTRRGFAKDTAIKDIEFDIRRAKAEAVSKNVRGIIEIAPGGQRYTLGLDTFPFSDPPEIDETIIIRELPEGTHVSTPGSVLYFGTRGFLTDEDNTPITGAVTFYIDGTAYAVGEIYATGVFLLKTYI